MMILRHFKSIGHKRIFEINSFIIVYLILIPKLITAFNPIRTCYINNDYCLEINEVNPSKFQSLILNSENVCPEGKKLLEIRNDDEQKALERFLSSVPGIENVRIPLGLTVNYLDEWCQVFEASASQNDDIQELIENLDQTESYSYVEITFQKSKSYKFELQSSAEDVKFPFICHVRENCDTLSLSSPPNTYPTYNGINDTCMIAINLAYSRFEAANFCFENYDAGMLRYDTALFDDNQFLGFLYSQKIEPQSNNLSQAYYQTRPPTQCPCSWWLLDSRFQFTWTNQRDVLFTDWGRYQPMMQSNYAYIRKKVNSSAFHWYTSKDFNLSSYISNQGNINGGGDGGGGGGIYNNNNNNSSSSSSVCVVVCMDDSETYDDDDDGMDASTGSSNAMKIGLGVGFGVLGVIIAIIIVAILIRLCYKKKILRGAKNSSISSRATVITLSGYDTDISTDSNPTVSKIDEKVIKKNSNADGGVSKLGIDDHAYQLPLSDVIIEHVYKGLQKPAPKYLEIYDELSI